MKDLIRRLEALIIDCENTDGWESAAPTLREVIAHVTTSGEQHLYDVAAAMWREDARHTPGVAARRTPEAFLEEHVQTRENWKHLARIAIEMTDEYNGLTQAKVAKNDGFTTMVSFGMSEGIRAMTKYPQPNYVITKIAEEAGEVVKAAVHCSEGRETMESVESEMIQLVAMLYRLWVEGDEVHGLKPVGEGYSS